MTMRYLLAELILLGVVTSSGCYRDPPLSMVDSKSDLEARRQSIKQKEVNVSDEAQSRKNRSHAILKSHQIKFLESLPVIETEAQSKRRTEEEVATRAMALCVVAVKGEGLEQDVIDSLIEKYKLASAFTPKEQEFIKNPHPTQMERVQFAWRYECYWVLLWSLGYIDKLEAPDKICEVKQAISIMKDLGRAGFLQKAKLRSQSEILDAADLIYRYHWVAVDARVNGQEAPAGLDSGVVMERHYALNWLMGYLDQEWDDISTDT